MKFFGNNRPETRRPALPLSALAYVGWSGVALFATAAAIAACIPAGECTGDCADVTAGGASGGSGSGGSGGGSGGNKPSSPPSDLAVADCSAHPTIADVESAVIVKTCGNVVCHGNKTSETATDMKTAGIAARLLNAKPKVICQTDKLIDPDAPEKSILLRKLEDSPKCNDDAAAGEKMPGSGSLSDDDKKCLTNYVKAIADWSKQ